MDFGTDLPASNPLNMVVKFYLELLERFLR
jgi:hypothetical protein